MIRIAANAPVARVTYVETPAAKRRREREEKKNKKVASLATAKAASMSLRELPWPEFLERLQNQRDRVVRAHIRWAMGRAVSHCETLRRAEGRCFELRPGGRGNIVVSGGMWSEDRLGNIVRLGRDDARILMQSGRFLEELDDNLRRYLVPEWALRLCRRAIRAKLAKGWNLDEEEAA